MSEATQTRPSAPISSLAVTALVLALIPCTALLGVILGVVALVRINASKGLLRGRNFARAAIVVPLLALPLTILAALPAVQRYQCGSAQTEARFVLRALHAAQEGFRLENNRYAKDIDELGFTPGGESNYGIRFLDADVDRYRAEAKRGEDVWLVDERGAPENTRNACK